MIEGAPSLLNLDRGWLPIGVWAAQNEKEGLTSHILSASMTYDRLGINRKLFLYNPDIDAVALVLKLQQFHVGHKIDSLELVHGGIQAFIFDAVSGALAFTKARVGQIPVTQKNDIGYTSPAELNGGDLVSVSELLNKTPSRREMIVKTTIFQGERICSSCSSEITLTPGGAFLRKRNGHTNGHGPK